MKKTIFLCLAMLIVMSGVVFATQYSTDKTDYYYNGSHYMVEGIDGDVSVGGTTPNDGAITSLHGLGKFRGDMTYSDNQAYTGSLSISGDNGIGMQGAILGVHANTSFTGSMGIMFYDDEAAGNDGSLVVRYNDGNDQRIYIAPTLGPDANLFKYIEDASTAQPCDENTIERINNSWYQILFNWIDSSTVKAYIDGTLCHTFTNEEGMSYTDIYTSIGSGRVYFDEWWVANGDRPIGDTDGDGILDKGDNCRYTPNTNQDDIDDDCSYFTLPYLPDPHCGDACDNCLNDYNPLQEDNDEDGEGDACDDDDDNDGVLDVDDNCPFDANSGQEDNDEDGEGDACDDDDDNDGILDIDDECPFDADNDADGDDVCGDVDNCPTVYNIIQINSDNNSLGDACDAPVSVKARLSGIEVVLETLTNQSNKLNAELVNHSQLLENQSTRISVLKSWKQTIEDWQDTIENWKGTIDQSISNMWAAITENKGNIEENKARIQELEIKNIAIEEALEYFDYLKKSDKEKILCGYAQDNNQTNITSLGYACSLEYDIKDDKIDVKCKCEET